MPIPAAFDLSGRVAVVTGTGGTDGIGFAAARLLAELGAAVMISATTARLRDRVSELRSAGFGAAGIAAAIARLASPGASYITGQYLVVDGGNSIAEQRATSA